MSSFILTGPAPVIFGASAPNVQVLSLLIDPNSNSYSIVYVNPAAPTFIKTIQAVFANGNLPAVAVTLIEQAVAANEGWQVANVIVSRGP